MRTINKAVYQFDELSDEAKFKAIVSEIEFQIQTADENNAVIFEANEKMEKMQTPWFLMDYLYHEEKEYFIECIKANGDEFDESGQII